MLLLAEESHRIRGAVLHVYAALGAGFLEAVYDESLEIEFEHRGIPYNRTPLGITYRGRLLRQSYVPDFVCFDTVIVELKATTAIAREHRAQTINYLRASGHRLALLVNFGCPSGVEIERFAL